MIEILEGTDTRLIVVGGASSLFLDTEKTTRMIDQVPKNAPFYPTAFNMYEGLLKLKQSKIYSGLISVQLLYLIHTASVQALIY